MTGVVDIKSAAGHRLPVLVGHVKLLRGLLRLKVCVRVCARVCVCIYYIFIYTYIHGPPALDSYVEFPKKDKRKTKTHRTHKSI